MAPKVLLVGAGQLGSRHLQGLAHCGVPLEIHVSDPSAESLERARARWLEVAGAGTSHRVSFASGVASLPPAVDVAIVATSAGGRAAFVEEIARRCMVQAWVLEKVLAQSEGELDAIVAATAAAKYASVNVPRRLMGWHRELKAATATQAPTMGIVRGGDWGLACNAVHFLDYMAWWTGETLVEVCTDQLAPRWHASKRPGYWEINGRLHVRYSQGSELVLDCAAEAGPLVITLRAADGEWTLREAEKSAAHSDGRSLPGRNEFQSEMTGTVVQSILESGSCGLPSLEESVALHRIFLRSLLAHWNSHEAERVSRLPIT